MASKKSKKLAPKSKQATGTPAAKGQGRCRVCGHSVAVKIKVVDGLEQYTAPETCPTCNRPLQYDYLGPV